MEEEHSYLRRLDPEAYRGYAYVHWPMTMDKRMRGWLDEIFHSRFRGTLTHTSFRYKICTPLYCLMPDHLHLLWIGWSPEADQRKAARFMRTQLNEILRPDGFELQKQPFDNVLREKDRNRDAFPAVAAYVRENPLRARLVQEEEALRNYPFADCLVPGYPKISIWDVDFWDRFWKIYYEYLRE